MYVHLLTRKKHVNTYLATNHHQLNMPPISKDCSNTFHGRSFMYPTQCELNKLREHIRGKKIAGGGV